MWILFKSIHIHSFHVVTVWLRPWQHCESSMITPRAGLYLAAVQGSLKAFVKLVFTVNDYIISQLESISETEERERERDRNLLRWTRLDDMSSRSWTVITSQLHVCFISSSVHVLYELSMWIVLFVSALLTWHKSRINREQSAGDNALVLLLNEWWECDTFSQQLYKLQNWFVQLLRSRKGTLYTAVMNVIVEWLWVEKNLLHFSGFFFFVAFF